MSSVQPDDALAYLRELQARDQGKFRRAKEYVRKAPPQIQTRVRQLLKEDPREDWSDIEPCQMLSDARAK